MGSSFRTSAMFALSAAVVSLMVPLSATETNLLSPSVAGAESMTNLQTEPTVQVSAVQEQTEEIRETMNQLMIPAPITPTGTALPPTKTKPPAKTGASHPAPSVTSPGSPYPSRLVIPSIGLNVPVQGVGVNSAGEMAVPSGKSGAVGWYKNGTVPGYNGTAVLDAHVFAAFKQLDRLAVGSDIYVQTAGGKELHFVVREATTYALSQLTSSMLFGGDGTPRLNLITCAGKLTSDHTTYDHRLVVYAVLVG